MNGPLLQAIAAPAFDRLKEVLNRLGAAPPQVLLLEGGSEAQRRDMALYWATRINCPQASATGSPCLACPCCLQTATGEHLDLAAYDGRISNREDEENPGPVRAFNMERVRELKSRLRDAPHGSGRRVVVLAGLSLTRDEAANALLKALEEPSATTVFVLLAPQRETLLPTLVSRSFILTLAWPRRDAPVIRLPRLPEPAEEAGKKKKDAEPERLDEDQARREWSAELIRFLQTGQGWFGRTSQKGAVDRRLGGRVLDHDVGRVADDDVVGAGAGDPQAQDARRVGFEGPTRRHGDGPPAPRGRRLSRPGRPAARRGAGTPG